MFQIDFNTPRHIHFIGIGGISMSGLAEILLGKGFRISGSDNNVSALTKHLEEAGAVVMIGQSADHISPDTDLVVYTAAIHPDNPEFIAAKEQGIPMLSRAQLLGQIMQNYDLPINIAGTHGKTTTTSMCAHILMRAGLDPTVTLGGILPSIGGNIRVGGTKYFVAEACEYTNSFLSFFPKIELILNVDADHLDFFKDLDDIASSFHRFAALIPEDGTLIINRDTAKYDVVTDHLACGIITYSLNGDADYTAEDVHFNENGCASFVCLERGKPIGNFRLCIPGMHSVSNSLAVIALSRKLGLSPEIIAQGIADFHGADRRFERKGTAFGATIIDDYAHHPTEIRAVITAARQMPHKKLWVVFQPHTYTRTKALLPDFADALSLADHIVLSDIYAAREVNTVGISSEDLRAEIEKRGTRADYFSSFKEILEFLKTQLKEGDMLITMGAGNIVDVGEDLLRL